MHTQMRPRKSNDLPRPSVDNMSSLVVAHPKPAAPVRARTIARMRKPKITLFRLDASRSILPDAQHGGFRRVSTVEAKGG